MWGLEKNDKRALNHKVEMLIRSKNYKEWLKKNVKKRKPEPVRTDEEACTIIKSMIGTYYEVDEIYDAGEEYLFTRKKQIWRTGLSHGPLCAGQEERGM